MIPIKHRYSGEVLYSAEASTMRQAVEQAAAARADLGGADLGGADLGGADLGGAYLGGAYLGGAYLGDADLGGADLGGAYLRGAYLGGAYLGGADLRGADLRGADLGGADLGGAYLGGAYLGDAYLGGADLRGADLGGADLRGAAGLSVAASSEAREPQEPYRRPATPDERRERAAARMMRYRERHPEVPVVEALDRRILEAVTSGGGTLEMGSWHTCDTTHCRAGWAITLAGKAGAALEREHGPQRAGMMIYLASTGRAPSFFGSNEAAMTDIRRCAEIGAA